MKSVMEIYIKIPTDETVEQFLSCYLNFKSPLKYFQKAFESNTFNFETENMIHSMSSNLVCNEAYTYYGISNSSKRCLSSCPFENVEDNSAPIIASIDRIAKGCSSMINLNLLVAPIWSDLPSTAYGGKYLLVSSPRREYSGYVIHIRHPKDNHIWYIYVKDIISYAIKDGLTKECVFIYDDDK